MTAQSPILNPPSSVLVVDDTVTNLQLLAGLLKARGYRVQAAPSGTLALQAVQSNPPDLILLDITMPEMNGYEVCRRLKAEPAWAEIPIIFISALTETLDKVKAFGMGGVDYVTKPFQFEEVETRVATHLKLRHQQRELQAAYLRLQELERHRDSLVHLVIHDMRSPLCALTMAMELIESEAMPPELIQITGSISLAIKQLRNMVNSLLDVNKMEAGKLKLRLVPCDPQALITEAVQPLMPLKQNRQILVQVPTDACTITCDGDYVKRVVQNFLSNAIKFTPDRGTINVAGAVGQGVLRISVQDQGPGIPDEFQDKIFEKFAQLETAKPSRHYATGLGLYFSKLAIEAHGGRIGVESQMGHGSSFWFELPLLCPAP